MVKAYLRYELGKSFGVVTSGSALDGDCSGKLAITAANENLALWNLRQGTQVRVCQHRSNCFSVLSPYEIGLKATEHMIFNIHEPKDMHLMHVYQLVCVQSCCNSSSQPNAGKASGNTRGYSGESSRRDYTSSCKSKRLSHSSRAC